MTAVAFQVDAFQNDAFQVGDLVPLLAPTVSGGRAITWRAPSGQTFLKGVDAASYVFQDDVLKELRRHRVEKAAAVQSDEEDEMMAVFAAMMADEEF